MPKTILDEAASSFSAVLAEAKRSGADPAIVDELAVIVQAVVRYNQVMTPDDRREMNELHPVDPPAEWPADTMARRQRLRKRIDRRVNRALRSTVPAPAPQAPRAESRPRARRSPRHGTVKTAQDPGDGDGDPDPVAAAVAQLVGQAPPFSPGQRDLLGRILGGGR